MSTSTAVRRTQPERVEAMRARLLDATIQCLVNTGYAEMSTNDVVHRAGVSRGALAHHFPTKAQLVAAAADRLIKQRAQDFRGTFAGLAEAERTVPEAIDLLWSYYEGPPFAALLELTVAARTNPELRRVIADGPSQIAETTLEVFVELFPAMAGNPLATQMVQATLAMLAGLALQEIVDGDRRGHHRALRELIKAIGSAAIPAESPVLEPKPLASRRRTR